MKSIRRVSMAAAAPRKPSVQLLTWVCQHYLQHRGNEQMYGRTAPLQPVCTCAAHAAVQHLNDLGLGVQLDQRIVHTNVTCRDNDRPDVGQMR